MTEHPHEIEAEWDSEAALWRHHCTRCGEETWGEAPALPCEPSNRGWWTMSGDDFIEAMRRAHAGESPDLLYAEWYANSDIERFDERGDA